MTTEKLKLRKTIVKELLRRARAERSEVSEKEARWEAELTRINKELDKRGVR